MEARRHRANGRLVDGHIEGRLWATFGWVIYDRTMCDRVMFARAIIYGRAMFGIGQLFTVEKCSVGQLTAGQCSVG